MSGVQIVFIGSVSLPVELAVGESSVRKATAPTHWKGAEFRK